MSKRGRGRGTAPQKSAVAATMQAAMSQKHGSVALSQKHGNVVASQKHSSVVASQKAGSEELFMECVDEDLAPSQKEAGRRAESEYQTAVQRVQTAKSAVNADTSSSQAAPRSCVLPPYRGRGRPPKSSTAITTSAHESVTPGGRGGVRGRPSKPPVAITTATTTATATTGLSIKPSGARGRGRGASVTAGRGRGRGRGQAVRNTSAPPSDGKLSPVVAML